MEKTANTHYENAPYPPPDNQSRPGSHRHRPCAPGQPPPTTPPRTSPSAFPLASATPNSRPETASLSSTCTALTTPSPWVGRIVKGTYTLASRDRADLCLFATILNDLPVPTDPSQTLRIEKGTGSFRLIKTMGEDGYLHVSFYAVPSGNGFGGIYFGQGKWASITKTSATLSTKPAREAPRRPNLPPPARSLWMAPTAPCSNTWETRSRRQPTWTPPIPKTA